MDFLQDKIKKKQFLCNYSVFLLNGMLALSIGSLLPFIRDARGLDYAFCGLIVHAFPGAKLLIAVLQKLLVAPLATPVRKNAIAMHQFDFRK